MNRDQQRTIRGSQWRENMGSFRADVLRLHARGLDVATIAIRLGVRISRINGVLSSALDIPGAKPVTTRRSNGTRPKGKSS